MCGHGDPALRGLYELTSLDESEPTREMRSRGAPTVEAIRGRSIG